MSPEPRLEDDVALGLDETCDGCDEQVGSCSCSDFDTLEEKYE